MRPFLEANLAAYFSLIRICLFCLSCLGVVLETSLVSSFDLSTKQLT